MLKLCPGDKGDLGLIMTQFYPDHIICRGLSKPVAEDCRQVLNDVPATNEFRIFGREGPDVDVILPYVQSTGRE